MFARYISRKVDVKRNRASWSYFSFILVTRQHADLQQYFTQDVPTLSIVIDSLLYGGAVTHWNFYKSRVTSYCLTTLLGTLPFSSPLRTLLYHFTYSSSVFKMLQALVMLHCGYELERDVFFALTLALLLAAVKVSVAVFFIATDTTVSSLTVIVSTICAETFSFYFAAYFSAELRTTNAHREHLV